MAQTATVGFMQRAGLRQFVKFCIIGFTSMVMDVGILWYLTYMAHWNWVLAQILSFSIAVTNGFIWNSIWTFRGLGSGRRHEQYLKFVAVNIIGLVLNILIMKAILFVFNGELIHHGNPTKLQLSIAKGVAVVIVSLWNFFANKKWTFG